MPNDFLVGSQTVGNEYTLSGTTNLSLAGEVLVKDTSYIPYMREIGIDFLSYNLRPTREVNVFFDNVNMAKYWQVPNKVVLDTQQNFNDMKGINQEKVSIGNGQAKVYHTEINPTTGNTELYIGSIENGTSVPVSGNTITGLTSGNIANIVSYEHRTGFLRTGSNTSHFYLALDADFSTENVYVGNTITIVRGINAGQSANITEYNVASQLVKVSPAFSNVSANDVYVIGDSRKKYASNSVQGIYTTGKGFVSGTLYIPDPESNSLKFPTGDRIFRVIDSSQNDLNDYSTIADYRFVSHGTDMSITHMVGGSSNTVTIRNESGSYGQSYGGADNRSTFGQKGSFPFAYSFYVNPVDYPDGFFIPSIDLFFKAKSTTLPIGLELRPMISGSPSSDQILPNSVVVLEPELVKISETPNVSNALTATTFTFIDPVYVKPGVEYAIVLNTSSLDYEAWISELGEKILGTDRIISEQPSTGTLFKGQSGQTYTPLQSEDLMCVINKCVFETTGSISFHENKQNSGVQQIGGPVEGTNEIYGDFFYMYSDIGELPGTSISHSYKLTGNTSRTLDSTYTNFLPYKDTVINERKVLLPWNNSTESMNILYSLSSTNPDISPVIYRNRQEIVMMENRINNMPITNSSIVIANTGSGYTAQNTALTFTAPTGASANGFITANATTGAIESVVIDNEGFGYYDNVEVSISSSDGTGGSILVSHEMNKSGGLATARYITKRVLLKDNFDAGDLRVFVTAQRPPESNVQVYYKIRNVLDEKTIEDLNWKKMEQHTSPYIFSKKFVDPIEYEYRPSLSSNNVTYSNGTVTYPTFNEFQIKIVLASSSTLPEKLPYLLDFIATAFPADEY